MADGVAFEADAEFTGAPLPAVALPVAQADTDLTWSLVTDRCGLEALATDWHNLFAQGGLPHQFFQSYGWAWHWSQAYLDARIELAILVGRQNGKAVAIAPFTVIREWGCRVVRWMGEPIVQYGDILTARHLDPAATFKQVWHALNQLTRFDAAVLRHVREDAVANNIGQLASAQVSVHEEAPFVSCDAFSSFAEYDATLSSKKRKNRRRLWNRLNEEATVTTEVVGPGPRALEIMSAGLAHKRHWLDNKAVASTAFADQRLDHLMTAIARGDGPDVGLVAFAIVTNDEIAAVAITFETLGRLNGYMITYAPTHEKHGVGLLNTERMIQGAFDRGAKLFDFMAPSQDYKLAWTNNVVAVNDWVIPKTMRGRILAKAWELRPMLKAQFVRLPSWARRIITAAISRKLTQR